MSHTTLTLGTPKFRRRQPDYRIEPVTSFPSPPCHGNLIVSNPTAPPLLYDTGEDKYPDTAAQYFEWQSGVGVHEVYDVDVSSSAPPSGFSSYFECTTNPASGTTQIFATPSAGDPCGQRGNFGFAVNGTNYERKNIGVIAATLGDTFRLEGWFMRAGDPGDFNNSYGEIGLDFLDEDWHWVDIDPWEPAFEWFDPDVPFSWTKLELTYTVVDAEIKWVIPHWFILCDSGPPSIVKGRIGGMVFERVS